MSVRNRFSSCWDGGGDGRKNMLWSCSDYDGDDDDDADDYDEHDDDPDDGDGNDDDVNNALIMHRNFPKLPWIARWTPIAGKRSKEIVLCHSHHRIIVLGLAFLLLVAIPTGLRSLYICTRKVILTTPGFDFFDSTFLELSHLGAQIQYGNQKLQQEEHVASSSHAASGNGTWKDKTRTSAFRTPRVRLVDLRCKMLV